MTGRVRAVDMDPPATSKVQYLPFLLHAAVVFHCFIPVSALLGLVPHTSSVVHLCIVHLHDGPPGFYYYLLVPRPPVCFAVTAPSVSIPISTLCVCRCVKRSLSPLPHS